MDPERERLTADRTAWMRWGPYLAERAWGTVREDYSADGDAWRSFPHDHARSRAYRWNEDGLAGICDDAQRLCFAFAFWNGADPFVKERIFGLDGHEGNHGEDAKEYWWYLDATPTHSWLRWRYLYPQDPYPYDALHAVNAGRTRSDPEVELADILPVDTGRWWEITVEYAKAAVDDICVRLNARNLGSAPAALTVLPTMWFRNTWSWGWDDRRPTISPGAASSLVAEHVTLGRMVLAGEGDAEPLFCDNETNAGALWDATESPAFPKDGIGDHVVRGGDTVNPARTGTKAALRYRFDVAAGATAEIRLRLSSDGATIDEAWHEAMAGRAAEADGYYDGVLAHVEAERRVIARQALAGMIWSKQFFHLDVERWLDGDPAGPVPPASRQSGRNHGWRHLNNHDVISMPDTWEYPWYAAWDLAFHCVALAHVDATFAKEQLLLLCREWYMHPNGQLPAYEWSFGDVNPPVHAWAALRVSAIEHARTGRRDFAFLERILHKLSINFTWWVNRKDPDGANLFEGGFLGMDNIGPVNRSEMLPGVRLDQADGTGWMAMYCLNLLEISLVLAEHDATYEDLATKFLEHFAYIATAINERGLWDDVDGFFYDVLVDGDQRTPIKVRSMVGVVPLCASMTIGTETLDRLPGFASRLEWFLENKPHLAANLAQTHVLDGHEGRLLSIVTPERLRRVLAVVLDEDELLSPYGVRSLSKRHGTTPFVLNVAGETGTVDYEPGESTTGLFGGNSNWRGPVWFPTNYLIIDALRRFDRYLGPDGTIEVPTGSGRVMTLGAAADEIRRRLIGIFEVGPDGRRPAFGDGPQWPHLLFHEYFHGDTGKGLGASHQTGWTGLVADLIAATGDERLVP